MRRIAIGVGVVLLATASGAAAKPPARATVLERYVVKVDGQVGVFESLLRRLEGLLTATPHVNVDPLVEKLDRLAGRFDELEARWGHVSAPQGLRLRHRGMGRVVALYAEAIRIYAAALFTRHPDEFHAALPKVEARLRSAAYLQHRWAAALRGALIRAALPVPKWLRRLAIPPGP